MVVTPKPNQHESYDTKKDFSGNVQMELECFKQLDELCFRKIERKNKHDLNKYNDLHEDNDLLKEGYFKGIWSMHLY